MTEEDYLVEVNSNIPREIEVTAENEEEAMKKAQRELEAIIRRIMPDCELGRITKSGENKGVNWKG